MKPAALALTLFVAVVPSWSRNAHARPWRVNQVPNGNVATCLTCHVFPGGPRNAFGQTIEAYGGVGFLLNGDVQWGTRAVPETPGAAAKTLGQVDSDGDGRTNGEELLDATDTWRTGQPPPGDPALVRTPSGNDASVVIRQLFVAGGTTGATFRNDFIELFNRSRLPVSIGGWSLQYAPPTGSGSWGNGASTLAVLPSSLTLPAGQSYLVRGASGGANGAPLAEPDLITSLTLGDGGGKVVLVNDAVSLGCNGSPTTCTPSALAKIVDLVGYGSANTFEGIAAAVSGASNQAIARYRDGCTDIDNNGPSSSFSDVPFDFAPRAPVPRNRASVGSPCGGAPVPGVTAAARWILGLALLGLAAGQQAVRTRSTRWLPRVKQ